MNKVILIGNISNQPEVKTGSKDGRDWASLRFNLVTSEKIGDGYKREWHRCTWFGVRAQKMASYLVEGATLQIEGRLTTKKWTDRNGTEKYSTEIELNDANFLPKQFEPRTGDNVLPSPNESDVF